jgi:hypothetical protein
MQDPWTESGKVQLGFVNTRSESLGNLRPTFPGITISIKEFFLNLKEDVIYEHIT